MDVGIIRDDSFKYEGGGDWQVAQPDRVILLTPMKGQNIILLHSRGESIFDLPIMT